MPNIKSAKKRVLVTAKKPRETNPLNRVLKPKLKSSSLL